MPVYLRARRYLGNRDHGLVEAQVRVRLIRKFLACASENTRISRFHSRSDAKPGGESERETAEPPARTFALDGTGEIGRLEVDFPVIKAEATFATTTRPEEWPEHDVCGGEVHVGEDLERSFTWGSVRERGPAYKIRVSTVVHSSSTRRE